MPRPGIALLAMALSLAGCSNAPAADGTPAGEDGPGGVATGLWNYTTMHPGAAPFTRDYEGTLTAQETADCDCPPTGPAVAGVDSCCYFDWIPVDDLLLPEQLVAMRITLTWTNTQQDAAGLDPATCVPWFCESFAEGPDESSQAAAHTATMALFTSGRADFLDQVGDYFVGVRFQNAHVTTALPYRLHVEAHPVADGLALFDPYLIDVPANATLTAELVGPYRDEGVDAGFLVYDDTDRPVQWHQFSGPHGSTHEITGLAAGRYVLFQTVADGGFVRFSVDREPESLQVRRLGEEFGQVPVATVADAQAHEGTFTDDAPPRSLDTFPFFLHGDGVAVQDSLGAPNGGAVRGSTITLSSSSGDIAVVQQGQVSGSLAPLGRVCLQCNTVVDFRPENYLDDDGTYQVAWSVQGATGNYVLFTAQYVR